MKKKYLIVIANYYEDISKGLLDSALKLIPKSNIVKIITVPGIFEIPVTISKKNKQLGFSSLWPGVWSFKSSQIVVLFQTKNNNSNQKTICCCNYLKKQVLDSKAGMIALWENKNDEYHRQTKKIKIKYCKKMLK